MPTTVRDARLVESVRVPAMGSDAHIVVVGGPLGIAREGARRLAQLEQRWSRFLPTSDVARANERRGQAVAVHDETLALVRAAIDAWTRSAGRFDPTVHDALVALGYDRPFAEVAPRSPNIAHIARPAPGCAGIEIDVELGTLRLPHGLRVDFGGIGKGLAADLVVAQLRTLGADGALVSVGGDLRASGDAPGGRSWTIEVEDPFAIDRTLGLLAFASDTDVAVATSSVLGRRWSRGARVVHHLLDPSTGQPHDSSIVAVTVLGTRAVEADVATKVVIDGGPWPADLGPEPPCLVVHDDGRTELRGDAAAFFHPAAGFVGHLRTEGAWSRR